MCAEQQQASQTVGYGERYLIAVEGPFLEYWTQSAKLLLQAQRMDSPDIRQACRDEVYELLTIADYRPRIHSSEHELRNLTSVPGWAELQHREWRR